MYSLILSWMVRPELIQRWYLVSQSPCRLPHQKAPWFSGGGRRPCRPFNDPEAGRYQEKSLIAIGFMNVYLGTADSCARETEKSFFGKISPEGVTQRRAPTLPLQETRMIDRRIVSGLYEHPPFGGENNE